MNTSRLMLREFRDDDLNELEQILSDPLVMEFSSKGPLTRKEASKFIDWCKKSYEKYGYGQWAVLDKNTESLIGLCGLSKTEINGNTEIEIGYRFAQSSWGKGFATEAGEEVLRLGIEKHKLNSIIAIVSIDNHASTRVAEKLGFIDYSVGVYSGFDVRIYRKSG